MGVENGFTEVSQSNQNHSTHDEDGYSFDGGDASAIQTADSWLSRLPWCVAGMALAFLFMVPLHLSRGSTPAAETSANFVNDPPRPVIGTTLAATTPRPGQPSVDPGLGLRGTTPAPRSQAFQHGDLMPAVAPPIVNAGASGTDGDDFRKIFDAGEIYTIYYISGCWPRGLYPPVSQNRPNGSLNNLGPCEEGQFEIAAAEFDAFSGNLRQVRNITDLNFRRLDALKLTPDQRYVVFVASLANDIGNLYVTGTGETGTQMALPLLNERQLDALDAQCSVHSRAIIKEADRGSGNTARLAGYKQLQVVIPTTPAYGQQGSTQYRAAFSYECAEPGNPINRPVRGIGYAPLRFTRIAIVDFQLPGNGHLEQQVLQSDLRVINPTMPPKMVPWSLRQVQFSSHECPRFVPSRGGHTLLFVAMDAVMAQHVAERKGPGPHIATEHLALVDADPGAKYSAGGKPRQMCCRALTAQCLACSQDTTVELFCQKLRGAHFPGCEKTATTCCKEKNAVCYACREGKSVEQFCHEQGKSLDIPGCEEDAASETVESTLPFMALEAQATLLGGLPPIRILGCPEFIADLGIDNFGKAAIDHPLRNEASQRQGDTFTLQSDLTVSGVAVGLKAQEVAVSLPRGEWSRGEGGRLFVLPKGRSGAELLFNIDGPKLVGCQPVKGILGSGSSAELRLACVDEEQRLVILESREQEDWMRIYVPHEPLGEPRRHLERHGPWCPPGRDDACFEAWLRHESDTK